VPISSKESAIDLVTRARLALWFLRRLFRPVFWKVMVITFKLNE